MNFFVRNPEEELPSFGSGNALLLGWRVVCGTEQCWRVGINRVHAYFC